MRTTWRWMFWAKSTFQAAMIFVSFFSFHESYGLLILRRRTERLRRQTGNQRYYTADEWRDGQKSATSVITQALTRPLRLLMFHPIIQVLSILSGFNYGILYIMLSTFSDLWKIQYHQSVHRDQRTALYSLFVGRDNCLAGRWAHDGLLLQATTEPYSGVPYPTYVSWHLCRVVGGVDIRMDCPVPRILADR